jgi:hypothetical protein
MPGPTPAPTPVPEPVRPPAKGEWAGLLRTRPTTRVWTGAFGTRLDHDPAGETLSVQVYSPALVALGRTDAPGYRIQLAVRQTRWTGGFGVYFGGRNTPDGRFRCQLIEFREFQPATGRPWAVVRGTAETDAPGGTHVRTAGFASTVLTQLPGNQEQLAELAVGPRGLSWFRWNGDPCHELAAGPANAQVGPGEYAGEFGFYGAGSATLVSSARYMTTH